MSYKDKWYSLCDIVTFFGAGKYPRMCPQVKIALDTVSEILHTPPLPHRKKSKKTTKTVKRLNASARNTDCNDNTGCNATRWICHVCQYNAIPPSQELKL